MRRQRAQVIAETRVAATLRALSLLTTGSSAPILTRVACGVNRFHKYSQLAKREEQIDRVMQATVGMYGDLQGLVPALPSIALLELPEAEEPILAAS